MQDIGSNEGTHELPLSRGAIRARLLFDWAIAHPTVVLRPGLLRELGLRYDPTHLHAEDYGLWVELSRART